MDKELELLKETIEQMIERVQNGRKWGDELLSAKLEAQEKRLCRIEEQLNELSKKIDEKLEQNTSYIRRINLAFVSSFLALVISFIGFIIKIGLK